jgi:hypothetical protein
MFISYEILLIKYIKLSTNYIAYYGLLVRSSIWGYLNAKYILNCILQVRYAVLRKDDKLFSFMYIMIQI